MFESTMIELAHGCMEFYYLTWIDRCRDLVKGNKDILDHQKSKRYQKIEDIYKYQRGNFLNKDSYLVIKEV